MPPPPPRVHDTSNPPPHTVIPSTYFRTTLFHLVSFKAIHSTIMDVFEDALLLIQEIRVENRIESLLFDYDVTRAVLETDVLVMEAFMQPRIVIYPDSALQNITHSSMFLTNLNLDRLRIMILWREEMFYDLTDDMSLTSRDTVMAVFQDVCAYCPIEREYWNAISSEQTYLHDVFYYYSFN